MLVGPRQCGKTTLAREFVPADSPNYFDIGGLSLNDTGATAQTPLWGYPQDFLAVDDEDSLLWRCDFVQTFIERDVPAFGLSLRAPTLHCFWTMLAH